MILTVKPNGHRSRGQNPITPEWPKIRAERGEPKLEPDDIDDKSGAYDWDDMQKILNGKYSWEGQTSLDQNYSSE